MKDKQSLSGIVSSTKQLSEQGFVKHFIHPGEFVFGGSNLHIHTILGSCIAITLWHPILKIGGMCHFVLPKKTGGISELSLDGRYCDGAMALFEKEAHKHGTNLDEYQGKIFGGSNMLTNLTLKEDELVGTKNTEAAVNWLLKKGVSLLVAHVGETGHRRIVFDVANGDVWVKHSPLQDVVPNSNRP
ncbi:MAG: chemotaxis protein CheD [Bermanella sp.]